MLASDALKSNDLDCLIRYFSMAYLFNKRKGHIPERRMAVVNVYFVAAMFAVFSMV